MRQSTHLATQDAKLRSLLYLSTITFLRIVDLTRTRAELPRLFRESRHEREAADITEQPSQKGHRKRRRRNDQFSYSENGWHSVEFIWRSSHSESYQRLGYLTSVPRVKYSSRPLQCLRLSRRPSSAWSLLQVGPLAKAFLLSPIKTAVIMPLILSARTVLVLFVTRSLIRPINGLL